MSGVSDLPDGPDAPTGDGPPGGEDASGGPVTGRAVPATPVAPAAPITGRPRTEPFTRRRVETIRLLASAARLPNKVPQDAAAVTLDGVSGARAYVVADGVTLSQATPRAVRRFAAATASSLSNLLVENAGRVVSADLAGAQQRVRRVLAVNAQTPQQAGFAGASCVVGGVLFVPQPGTLFVFALGNVALVLRVTAPALPEPLLIALSGSRAHFLRGGDTSADIEQKLEVHAVPLGECSITLAVMSDGAQGPCQAGYLCAPRSTIEAMPGGLETLSHWALIMAESMDTGDGADFSSLLVNESPDDDATALTGAWSTTPTGG